jgi:hypothetical protein
MAVQLTDGSNNNVIDVTSKGILVQNPKVQAQSGFVAMTSMRDIGTVTGAPTTQDMEVSLNRRVRVGIDVPIFQDQFNYTAQNTATWNYVTSTMTTTWAAGYAALNGGNSVASGNYTVLKTYRALPLYNAGTLLLHMKGYFTQAVQANNAMYFGVGIPGTTTAPTDGVYFQLDATGVLRGIANWNSVQTQTASITFPSINVDHDWKIIVDDSRAEFWIDGILQGFADIPSGAQSPSISPAASIFFQMTNSGVVAIAQQFRIQNVQAIQMDIGVNRTWAHAQAGTGLMSYQGQSGNTMGSTALYVNSTPPTAAVPTNTTAALGSGLGGNFYETTTLAAGTDGIIASFQNPAGSVAIPPRNLIITGIRWYTAVQTVLAGGPFVYECGIAFGHTAVSLATAEAGATKAPRRFPMGLYVLPSAAAVGTLGAQFVHTFQSPIVVQPGEFIQTVVKNIGTVGTSGTIVHHIGFEGYWE